MFFIKLNCGQTKMLRNGTTSTKHIYIHIRTHLVTHTYGCIYACAVSVFENRTQRQARKTQMGRK